MNVFGIKEAVPAGGLSPVNCDRKGNTIISNHVDVLLLLLLLFFFFFKKNNTVLSPSENSQGSSRTSEAAWPSAGLEIKS